MRYGLNSASFVFFQEGIAQVVQGPILEDFLSTAHEPLRLHILQRHELHQCPWSKPVEQVEVSDLVRVVEEWKEAVVTLDKLVYEDAKKEFSLNAHTGFGADGDDKQNSLDFENVRGKFESNAFVLAVLEHIRKKSALGDAMLERLRGV